MLFRYRQFLSAEQRLFHPSKTIKSSNKMDFLYGSGDYSLSICKDRRHTVSLLSVLTKKRKDNKMKRLLLKLLVLFIIVSICIVSLIIAPWPRNDPFQFLKQKHSLLKNAVGNKKIILVGGSGTFYSLSAEQMEEALPEYRVINMALNAGLGLEFNLNEIKDYIEKGDIIVLSPEYGNFSGGYAGGVQILKAVNILPETRAYVDNTKMRKLIIQQGLDFIRIKFQSYLDSLVVSLSETREHINNNGDIITRNEPRDVSAMPFTYIFETQKVEECVRLLNSFYDYCNSVGAITIFAFPSIPMPQYQDNIAHIDQLYSFLKANSKMKIICDPQNVVYDPNYFEDTIYHLNKNGRAKRTEQIARFLSYFIDSQNQN